MFGLTKSCISRFYRDTSGVTLVEYGIAITLAIFIGAATFATLGAEISDSLTTVGSQMPD